MVVHGLSLAIQWLVAALLLLAAIGKLLAGGAVNTSHLARYKALPPVLLPVVAQVLPPLELALSAGLLLRFGATADAVVCSALFLGFALTMGVALSRGIVTECGCYGTLHSSQVSWKLVIRNVLIAVLLLASLLPSSTRSPHGHASIWIVHSCVFFFALGTGAVLSARRNTTFHSPIRTTEAG